MIDRKPLLGDLQRLLAKLEADLLERSDSAELPQVGQTLGRANETGARRPRGQPRTSRLAQRCDHAGGGSLGAVLCVRTIPGGQPA